MGEWGCREKRGEALRKPSMREQSGRRPEQQATPGKHRRRLTVFEVELRTKPEVQTAHVPSGAHCLHRAAVQGTHCREGGGGSCCERVCRAVAAYAKPLPNVFISPRSCPPTWPSGSMKLPVLHLAQAPDGAQAAQLGAVHCWQAPPKST